MNIISSRKPSWFEAAIHLALGIHLAFSLLAARIPMSTEGYYVYTCLECPCASECNPKKIASWKPWGYTVEQVKEQVMAHLQGSGFHRNAQPGLDREEEYMSYMNDLNIEDSYEPPTKVLKTKREATMGTGKGYGKDSDDKGKGSGAGDERVEHVVERVMNRMLAPASSSHAIVPGPPGLTMLNPKAAATALSVQASSKVTMSVTELKDLADTMQRASRACGHVARLCAAAATAAQEEKLVIDEARDCAAARLSAAGLQWQP